MIFERAVGTRLLKNRYFLPTTSLHDKENTFERADRTR